MLIVFIILPLLATADQNCEEWFLTSKIKPNTKDWLFFVGHESDSILPENEVDMDTINNQLGYKYSVSNFKNETYPDLDELEKEALRLLKEGKLKVLKPSSKSIPKGYYSNDKTK